MKKTYIVMIQKNISVALLCTLIMRPIVAQTLNNDSITRDTHELQEVMVIEDVQKRQITSTAPLHILNNDWFIKSGITDIGDALNRLPGITLRDYGGAGGMKTASVRSFGAQHTGVCYDGIMLSECQSGQIDVSRYSLDNVEYISLTIGDNDDIFIPAKNASTPAVLNIQTIQAPTSDLKPHLTTQIKFGSFGYISPFIKYEQNFSNKFAFSILGEYVYADNNYPFKLKNISIVTKEHRTNSRMNSGHGEGNIVWNIDNNNQIIGKLYYYDNNRLLPGQVRYYTNISKEELHDQNFFAQILYKTHNSKDLSFKWNSKFNWAASKYKDGTYKGGINDADYWQRELYTSACLLYAPTKEWSFNYSADYCFNNLNSSLATDTRPYRHSILQSATAKYKTGRFTALGRLLYSLYFNDAKDGDAAKDARHLSPSLSLSYKIFADYELYVRASYKNIFRVPTFNESYFFHYGSTNLSPEKTDQYNIGLTWQQYYNKKSNIRITIDGYVNHIKDKIVAVPYNMFVWTNINVGKVRVIGLDATFNVSHHINNKHSLLFALNYSLPKAENRTNPESPYYGTQIAYTPEHSGSASITYENPWINLSFHGTGTSLRYSNNEHYEDSEIEGYLEFGVTAYRKFRLRNKELSIRGDIKNIFNKQYELVKAYPMPGISYQISINYKF